MSQLTILQAPGKCLTKIFERGRNGQIVKRSYDSASLFHSRVHEFLGVDGLFDLQTALQRQPDCCVVHATPGRWHPGGGKLAPRRLYAAGELADDSGRFHKPARKGTAELWQRQEIAAGRLRSVTILPPYEAAATDVMMLDFEKITLPAGIDWRADLGYAAACLRLKLPPGFHGRRCTYFATSSAADLTKPDLGGDEVRMRIGFVLDRLIGYGEAKRWLAGVEGLDDCTLRPIQIIYTAAPQFRNGLHDPIPDRLGLLDGPYELVAVPHLEAPRQYRREAFTALGPVRSAEGLGLLPSPGMDAALERLAEHGGASGSVRSTLLHATFAYIRDAGRDCVDIDALADALTTAAGSYRSAGEIAGYGLDNLIAWSLEQAPADPPPQPHYPAKGLPPEEAAAVLRREMAEAIGAAVAWRATNSAEPDGGGALDFNDPASPPCVGIKAGAGIGKTGAALEQIAAIPGVELLQIEMYVPDHVLAEELATRVRAAAPRLRVIVLRGRGTTDKPERALCKKTKLAEQVAKAGLNVMGTLCRLRGHGGEAAEECEFAPRCPYLAQFRDTAPAVRIMPHANLFVVRNQDLPTPDLVVIDERFWPGALMHKRLALDRLTEAGRWRARPRKGEAPWKASERALEAEDCAIRVRNAFQDGRDPRSGVSAEDCELVAAIEWGSLTGPGITPGMSLLQQTELMQGWQHDECAKAGKFWHLLAEEHRQPTRPMQRIVLERDAQSTDGDRRHLLHLHYCRKLRLPAVPLILLDADLDPLLAAKLTPGLRMVEIPVRQQAHVVQVVDRSCSMRFLLGSEAGDEADQRRAAGRLSELQRLATRLLAGGGLLVTYKGALERLELPDTVSTLHLGNLRGRDGFKQLDTAVIAGRLEPGALMVEGMARALFGDEAEPLQTIAPNTVTGRVCYPRQTRRCRMTQGLLDSTAAGPPVDVPVHPDSRAQAILQQIREREIEQAVARLRLGHPVEDLAEAVGRLDEQLDRVGGREILDVPEVQLVQPEPDRRVDAVHEVERERAADLSGFGDVALEPEPAR